MKISHQWLCDYIKSSLSIEEISELLTDLGLEVESVTSFESVQGGLQGVVVGSVLTCEPHPNADKLKLTTIDIGQEVLQIVCGASNMAPGQKVPVATIGTLIYSEKEVFKIKKNKI